MAKVNINQEFLTIDGVVVNSERECVILQKNGVDLVKNQQGEELITVIKTKDSLTLKRVCVDSLLVNQNSDNVSGEDKVKKYLLAMKIYGTKKEVELESEEIADIKEIIGKGYPPLIVGQAYLMLEGKDLPIKKKK